MTHTKEPWEIKNGSTGPYIIGKDDKENHVAIAQVFPRGVSGCETLGNARLMKAAPKMYEVLKVLCRQVPKSSIRDCPADISSLPCVCGWHDAMDTANEILAEVEGKEGEDVFTMGNTK